MMVRGGILLTPPVSANLLEGVVRRSLIELAKNKLGLEVQERQIDRSELYMADEAFFCGTGVQMAAITSIDHRTIGEESIGPVTRSIGELLQRVLVGDETDYMHWLSPVYS